MKRVIKIFTVVLVLMFTMTNPVSSIYAKTEKVSQKTPRPKLIHTQTYNLGPCKVKVSIYFDNYNGEYSYIVSLNCGGTNLGSASGTFRMATSTEIDPDSIEIDYENEDVREHFIDYDFKSLLIEIVNENASSWILE